MAQQQDEDGRGGAQRGDEQGSPGKIAQIGEAAQEAGRQAVDAASALASQATDTVQEAVKRQVRGVADVVAEVADALRAAGRRLDENMPQAAFVARSVARRVEDLSETVRDQSPRELFQATSDFARRRPTVVFGATAALGFVVFRLLNAAPPAEAERSDEEDRGSRERDREQNIAAKGGASQAEEQPAESAEEGAQTSLAGEEENSGGTGQSRKSPRTKSGQRGGTEAQGS